MTSSVPLPVSHIQWTKTYRIIPSRYPPMDLFERIAPTSDWDVLNDLESLTNTRLRNETGEISLVPKERRVFGPGASLVMAPFCHLSRQGSRFSDGSYGVYYAGKEFQTALKETTYHMGKFYAETQEETGLIEDFRVLMGGVNNMFHDIRSPLGQWEPVYHPENYSMSQTFGKTLRETGSNGVVYNSVRNPNGSCIAAFWPNAVGIPVQAQHIKYHWNGAVIDKYFDYQEDEWIALAA